MSKVQKEKKRELATYYREKGFSYSEIAGLCGVSKGTISNWFRGNLLSKQVAERNTKRAQVENAKRLQLINKIRKRDRIKQQELTLEQAKSTFTAVSREPLFVAGVTLSKTMKLSNNQIRLSSTDIEQQLLWLRFLQRYAGISGPQVRFQLTVYQSQDMALCEQKWQHELQLPSTSWYKTQYLSQGDATHPPLHFGVGSTIIASASLVTKLNFWQTELWKSLLR